MSATGTDLDDLLKDETMKKLYDSVMQKDKDIDESMPKSALERVHRTVRPRKKRVKNRFMLGRIMPRKNANNDPGRTGNRTHMDKANATEAVEFVRDNLGKSGAGLSEALDVVRDLDGLHSLVSHVVAVRLGGWRERGGEFVNESGRTASPAHWSLQEDRLVSRYSGQRAPFDLDWFLEVRSMIDDRRE